MKIYFDRTKPFYLCDTPTFDGTCVDVDPNALQLVGELRQLINSTEHAIREGASPERANQQIAEDFVDTLFGIVDGYKELLDGDE